MQKIFALIYIIIMSHHHHNEYHEESDSEHEKNCGNKHHECCCKNGKDGRDGRDLTNVSIYDLKGTATGSITSTSFGLDCAEFYGISNSTDYPAPIAINAPLNFPHNGVTSLTIVRNNNSATDFLLQSIGVYLITFQGSFNEPGQLTLFLDPNIGVFNRVANTTVGRATGTSQIVGNTLLKTTVAYSKIRIVNDASPAALTVTPLPGGTEFASVSITIVRLA